MSEERTEQVGAPPSEQPDHPNRADLPAQSQAAEPALASSNSDPLAGTPGPGPAFQAATPSGSTMAGSSGGYPGYGLPPVSGTAAYGPQPGTHPPARVLRRSRDERMVAGVCGGLARYWNTDPVLLRILTVVLTIATGGALLIGYVIAWLAIQLEEQPVGAWPGYPAPGSMGPASAAPPWPATVPAGTAPVGPPVGRAPMEAASAGAMPSLAAATDPTVVLNSAAGGPGVDTGSGYPYTGDPASSQLGYAYGGNPPYSGLPGSTAGYPPPARPPRERSYLGWLVLSAAILAIGVIALIAAFAPVGVSVWGAAGALGLTVIGLGLVAGTWYGRARWLIFFAVPLAFITLATVSAANWVQNNPNWDRWRDPVAGGTTFGERRWAPTPADVAAADGPLIYNLSAGSAVLDLRELSLDEGNGAPSGDVRIDAGVGLGELIVIAPADMRIDLNASVDLGSIEVTGQAPLAGNDLDMTTTIGPRTTQTGWTVTLDAAIGAGELEVRNEAA